MCDRDTNFPAGFFYSHVGWLLVRKTKEVKEKRETIDMSDLDADPYVTFHRKYGLLTVFFLNSMKLPYFVMKFIF